MYVLNFVLNQKAYENIGIRSTGEWFSAKTHPWPDANYKQKHKIVLPTPPP